MSPSVGDPGVHHDLVHQITVVRTLIKRAISAPESAEPLLEAALSEVSAMLTLVDSIHWDGAPSPQLGYVPPREFGAAAVCDVETQLADLARATAVANTLTVELQATPNLLVALPPADLGRILRNLLGNAAAAAGVGGQIVIKAFQDHDYVVIDISDDGPGVSPGETNRPGARGLEVVRTLLLAVGGRLTLATSSLGGARVILTIPAANS